MKKPSWTIKDEIESLNSYKSYCEAEMNKIARKISAGVKFHKGFCGAAGVSGVVSFFSLLGGAGTSDYADKFLQFGSAEYQIAQADFKSALILGVAIGAVSAGFAGLAYIARKFVTDKQYEYDRVEEGYEEADRELGNIISEEQQRQDDARALRERHDRFYQNMQETDSSVDKDSDRPEDFNLDIIYSGPQEKVSTPRPVEHSHGQSIEDLMRQIKDAGVEEGQDNNQ